MRAVSRHSPLAARHALTLIELLVTIVIMVTVLAGVIPLMSPNNNARKIREASRQLSSLIAQAQAQAARDGRPAGIAFREFDSTRPSPPYSGMALEAFMIAEPAPFAGFSEFSRVQIAEKTASPTIYGEDTSADENGGDMFTEYYRDDLDNIFTLTFYVNGAPDPLPPLTFQLGDVVEVDHRQFLIIDDAEPGSAPNQVEWPGKFLVDTTATANVVECVWMNRQPGQLPPPALSGGAGLEHYRIRRQPANTSDQPLLFPRGIGIDLLASGAIAAPGTPVPSDFPTQFDDSNPDMDPNVVGIMFNANGSLDSLHFDGRPIPSVAQVFMLMGAFENGNGGSQDVNDYDFVANPLDDRDELAQRRSRINWLNPDSRWVTVNRAGRVVTSTNNTSFDPSVSPYIDTPLPTDPEEKAAELRNRQKNGVGNAPGAREYAEQMQAEGGR